MAKRNKLDFVRGEVVSVQFMTETHTFHGAPVRRSGRRGREPAPPMRVVNKTRLFLQPDRGNEREFVIPECAVGVHEGHRLLLAFGTPKKAREPKLLCVVNESTGQRDERPDAIADVLEARPMFGVTAKAIALSALMFLVGWFLSAVVMVGGASGAESIAWALFFAFLTYPAWWAIAWLYERFAARRRRAETLAAFRARLPIDAPVAPAVTPPTPA
jgi:hypothetical protein